MGGTGKSKTHIITGNVLHISFFSQSILRTKAKMTIINGHFHAIDDHLGWMNKRIDWRKSLCSNIISQWFRLFFTYFLLFVSVFEGLLQGNKNFPSIPLEAKPDRYSTCNYIICICFRNHHHNHRCPLMHRTHIQCLHTLSESAELRKQRATNWAATG